MQDIKFIRENLAQIKKAAEQKNLVVDLDRLLQIDEQRRKLQSDMDGLRAEKNKLSGTGVKPSDEDIKKVKEIKGKLDLDQKELDKTEDEYWDLMVKVPTIPSLDTPVGKSDQENKIVATWGTKPEFDFKPKSYLELARDLDLLDLERGAKVAGYRGYYVKNEAVLLEMAFMYLALEKLYSRGYTLMIPPTLVKEFPLFGSGYFGGKKYDPNRDEIYKIANDEKLSTGEVKKEDRFLVGTAEPSLLAYYSGEVLDEKDLPMKICGFSQCYRSEIGSYGRDTTGIYRVHEFMKVEQVVLSKASKEESNQLHEEIFDVSKELHKDLGLPYHAIQMCTGDLTVGKYKQYDIEAWIPSKNGYGETGSASNFLDWQARRLNVRYKDTEGNKKFVYMLNDTALPSPRILIALLENHQQADGSIKIPEVLHKYLPFKEIRKKLKANGS
ncbi:MAG TPA: serine--tRNA ligase [bacterium]|nr:serine--tRNA ligase [bacterium]